MMLLFWKWTASSTICRSSSGCGVLHFLCCVDGVEAYATTPRRRRDVVPHWFISAQIYVESHLSNTAPKFYGELTQQMIKMGDSPGSDNGTGTDAAWSINFEGTRSS